MKGKHMEGKEARRSDGDGKGRGNGEMRWVCECEYVGGKECGGRFVEAA